MYKYRHFPIFLGLAGLLLLLFVFPASFDNNDDQYMYFISSGILSGQMAPELLLTHFFIGKMLNTLFSLSSQVNWYSLFLQAVLILSFVSVFFVLVSQRHSFFNSILLTLFVLLGFAALCFVKIQFTTVSLFCGVAVLLCLQSEMPPVPGSVIIVLLTAVSILIRKESFYVMLLFFVPIVISKFLDGKTVKQEARWFYFFIFFFIATNYLNSHADAYRQQDTYAYLKAQDIIAAKPIRYDDRILKKGHFSSDDIVLLQNWFPADHAYMTGKEMQKFAEEAGTSRSFSEMTKELIKTAEAERYVLSLYVFSFVVVFLFTKKARRFSVLNLIAAAMLFLYLSACSRQPHRIVFPIFAYLMLTNLFLFMNEKKDGPVSRIALLLFFLAGSYKFYCVTKVYSTNEQSHRKFEQYQQEINAHPDKLFIGLYDGYPVEWMNTKMPPLQFGAVHNLILSGWYAYSPDYKLLLRNHRLKNLTSDLRDKKNVLFLTDSETILKAYVQVMQQRYGLRCHFEDVRKDFKMLHPKALVFDN